MHAQNTARKSQTEMITKNLCIERYYEWKKNDLQQLLLCQMRDSDVNDPKALNELLQSEKQYHK